MTVESLSKSASRPLNRYVSMNLSQVFPDLGYETRKASRRDTVGVPVDDRQQPDVALMPQARKV